MIDSIIGMTIVLGVMAILGGLIYVCMKFGPCVIKFIKSFIIWNFKK